MRALITGITGQDGSYLAELLLDRGYEVHGLVRRVATSDPSSRLGRIAPILGRLHLIPGSVECYASVFAAVERVRPTECYHLAAQSFVSESFRDPHSTMLVNVQGTLHVLETIRQLAPECRTYFAATSEMFGDAPAPQNESTPFHPRSPYAVSKVAGYHLARNYREAYSMHVSSGILMNHESPRRGPEFVTRKITMGVADVVRGRVQKIRLGNLDALRDWGHARDYVEAMWRMLQQSEPSDYVVATGRSHSVREFCELAFSEYGLDHEKHVEVDPQLYRPAEVNVLRGDASRATAVLGWEPRTGFADLVREMVRADVGL